MEKFLQFNNKKYISYGLDSYIKSFKEYIYHKSDLTDRISKLEDGLSTESKFHVERFLHLMEKIPLPSKDFLVSYESLYNEEEKKQIKEEKKFHR